MDGRKARYDTKHKQDIESAHTPLPVVPHSLRCSTWSVVVQQTHIQALDTAVVCVLPRAPDHQGGCWRMVSLSADPTRSVEIEKN